MQQTLDIYFNTSRRRIVPENFCLYWSAGYPSVSFDVKEHITHMKSTRIKFRGTIYDVNLFSNDSYEPCTFEKSKFGTRTAVPFLKSMLQKAIRRGLKDHAVYACYTLLDIDYMEVYRRLPIIMVEDVRLHKGFGVLVWHMMCNIPPSLNLVKWILGLVIFLCQVPTYEDYEKGCQLPKIIPHNEDVWTIIFRIEYGGMKGDIEMLTCIALKCLQNEIGVLEDEIKPFGKLCDISCSIVYEAVDFHIFPKLITIVSEKFDYDIEEVKKMMWVNVSSKNYRKLSFNYLPEKWLEMEFLVKQLQNKYLSYIKI